MTKIDFGAFEKKALMRCSVYSFLSNVFLNEPTKQFARTLKQGQLFQRISEFVNIQADFDKFEKYLKENEPQKIHELLLSDYRNLFSSQSEKYVPPYETDYREGLGGQHHGWSDLSVEVARKYSEAGFEVQPGYEGMPDHIGMELEFMALLCQREMGSWKSQDKDQGIEYLRWEEEFLREHLIKWVSVFCKKVIASSASEFFKVVAELTVEFVELENKLLGALVGERLK